VANGITQTVKHLPDRRQQFRPGMRGRKGSHLIPSQNTINFGYLLQKLLLHLWLPFVLIPADLHLLSCNTF
jgi:hypothetical protein